MKKMIGFGAALLCAAVGYADVEGQNIVGYTTATPESGELTNTGVLFKNCDGTDIDIQQIIPADGGDTEGLWTGDFEIRWFNGGAYAYAKWCSPVKVGGVEQGYAGWGDLVTEEKITKMFAPGQWFLVQPFDLEEPSVTVAGALVSADTAKPLYVLEGLNSGDLNFVGNPFPVTCDIQSILPMDDGDVDSLWTGDFEMRWFNGGAYAYAKWCAPVKVDGVEQGYAGWGDLVTEEKTTKIFAIGEGFLVQPYDIETPQLAFPNPLYSAK